MVVANPGQRPVTKEVAPHAEPSAGPGASAVQKSPRTENTPPATTDAARSKAPTRS